LHASDVEPEVREHVHRLAMDARKIALGRPEGSRGRKAFEALEQRLAALAKQSHSGRIRNFVTDTLTQAGEADARKLASDAIELYGLRGRLLHDGKAELGDALTRLDTIVNKVVAAELIRVSAS
jgi:hypothetical protein